MRETSKSFRSSTAQTYDGIHVKHWAALEDEGQDLLATFMCVTLALGALPSQIRTVVAAAIPKTSEGYRTIGLFPAYYRTLVRAVSPDLEEWEQMHPRKFYSFSAGRSAVYTVWSQTAQQELASAIGKPHSVTVLWDLSDFYEGMSRTRLLSREAAQDFPLAPAFLSLTAYAGERIIQLNGIAVSAGFPTRGVVAGCGIATYHVQAYHGPPMQAYVDIRPQIALNVHIDDLCISATDVSEEVVVQQISEGAAALQTLIDEELECSISIPKADLVATSDSLRKRVGKVLSEYGHMAHT